MNTKVFYELWQMECCGEPFKIGDSIEWHVFKAELLIRPLDIDGLEYVYDAHFDEWDGIYTLKGIVKGISIYYEKYKMIECKPHGMMVPIREINDSVQSESSHIEERDRNGLKVSGYTVELDEVTVRPAK